MSTTGICGAVSPTTQRQLCVLPAGHAGLHESARQHVLLDSGQVWDAPGMQWNDAASTAPKDMAEALAPVAAALNLANTVLTFSSADNSAGRDRATLWAILCGWDCEEGHDEHDELCGGNAAMDEVARRHGWSSEYVDELRRHRAAVRAVQETARR